MEACSLVALWCTRLDGTAPELAVRVVVGRIALMRISLCQWAVVAVSRRWPASELVPHKVLVGICFGCNCQLRWTILIRHEFR